MKIEINEKETQGEVKYPCLMKLKSHPNLIVLFLSLFYIINNTLITTIVIVID